MFISRSFKFSLLIFILINVFLYLFIFFFHDIIPFNTFEYYYHAYHYLPDPRYYHQSFDFFRALDQWDAQWYIDIASRGYSQMSGSYMYAFFPMYPLTVFMINYIFNNIELTAFIVSNIFLLADFISLYYIVTKLYDERIAFRTSILMFIYPFSIFYRSYFAEGLFLFFLLWFCYFLSTKKWFYATLFLAFLCVTRPTGMFLIPLYVILILKAVVDNKYNMSVLKFFEYSFVASIPFVGWLYYCYNTTGNSFFWMHTDTGWLRPSVLHPISFNITQLIHFGSLKFHYFGNSKIEDITLLIVIAILIFSKKRLKPELWWTCFLLAIPIPFIKDLISFSRFQSISFPLFLYISLLLDGSKFIIVCTILYILLLLTSLYFVNWYWVG